MTTPNTTCDIYRAGRFPPAAPDIAGVAITLRAAFRTGTEAAEIGNAGLATHIADMALSVDIRDGYQGQGGYAVNDRIYVPDQNGTPFLVKFVERVGRGTANEGLRVYLDREVPNWPTTAL